MCEVDGVRSVFRSSMKCVFVVNNNNYIIIKIFSVQCLKNQPCIVIVTVHMCSYSTMCSSHTQLTRGLLMNEEIWCDS